MTETIEPIKQTAVSWMIERLKTREYLLDQDIIEALEMERQQIIDAWKDGVKTDYAHSGTFELYYNETYNLTEPICDECGDGSGWYGNDIYPEYGSITMNCSKCNPQAE